jgi:hypothetical protein
VRSIRSTGARFAPPQLDSLAILLRGSPAVLLRGSRTVLLHSYECFTTAAGAGLGGRASSRCPRHRCKGWSRRPQLLHAIAAGAGRGHRATAAVTGRRIARPRAPHRHTRPSPAAKEKQIIEREEKGWGGRNNGEVGRDSLTNGSHMSYESRGFKIGGIDGVEGKINSPNKLGEPLLKKIGQNRGYCWSCSKPSTSRCWRKSPMMDS